MAGSKEGAVSKSNTLELGGARRISAIFMDCVCFLESHMDHAMALYREAKQARGEKPNP